MANAIKKISVQRGYDVTRYALNCFGGAGGQHACLVADALGMTRVLIHPFSSLLSAYGMGLADIRSTRQQAIELVYGAKALAALKREGARLGREAKAEVAGQGVPAGKIKIFVRAHIRYAGTDTALVVAAGTLPAMKRAFEKAHKARFGFIDRTKQMVVEAVSVEAVGGGAKFSEKAGKRQARQAAAAGAAHEIFLRRRMAQGQCLHARPAQARLTRQRRRHHHRAAPDHRGRAGLAGRTDARRTIWCSRARKNSSAPTPSAPMPIR